MKRLSYIFLFFIIAVCAGAQTREDSLAVAKARWECKKVKKGVKSLHCAFSELYKGPQDVYMVEVKLKKNSVEVLDHQGRALTSEKADELGARAAVNGTYFDMSPNGRSMCFTAKDGKVVAFTQIGNGQLVNGAVVADKDGVDIVPWNIANEHDLYPDSMGTSGLEGKDVMVAGPLLMQNGKEESFHKEAHILDKHPRSAIAVKGKKAYLIVVDGRAKGRAVGVSIPELAHMLRVLGMESALNLDGGGSSVLWTCRKDESKGKAFEGILNVPSDSGNERRVSKYIRHGKNVIATMIKQHTGGAYYDCGLIEQRQEGEAEKADAIKATAEGNGHDSHIYDLSGRQLPRMQSGINILDGKKVLK